MTEVRNLFHRFKQGNKVIQTAIKIATLGGIVLFTFFGIKRYQNVDKISNPLIFRYNEDVSVNTLDPAFIKSQSEIWIGAQIYEGLMGLDSTLNPVPELSKSVEIDESGTVYKFTLKSNVYFVWTDVTRGGQLPVQKQKLKVTDVAYSFCRLLSPKVASPGAWIFSDKMNIPQELQENKPENWNVRAICSSPDAPIQIVNDSTIVLRLTKPFPAFLSLLATNYCWIVPQFTQSWSAEKMSTQPVGTGPFYLRRWESDVKMVSRRNPFYHGKLAKLDAINVDFVKNKQTAFMQFMAGKYDFFNGVDASFRNELLTKTGELQPQYSSKINSIVTDFLNTEYIGFYLGDSLDGKLNPFKDRNLRKAMQLSVDQDQIIRFFRNGLGRSGNRGFVPPALLSNSVSSSNNVRNRNSVSHNNSINNRNNVSSGVPNSNAFDRSSNSNEASKSVENAQLTELSPIEFLKKSDYYKNPKRFATLKLTTTADYMDIAVYLQRVWKSLGLNVEIDLQTGGMLRQLRNQGKLGMFRGSWIADYPDAENYLSCFYTGYFSPNGPNYTHFSNAQFDQLFEEIAFGVVNSPEKEKIRKQKIAQANQILADEAPVIVLYYDRSLRLMQKNVQSLSNDAINRLKLNSVDVIKN